MNKYRGSDFYDHWPIAYIQEPGCSRLSVYYDIFFVGTVGIGEIIGDDELIIALSFYGDTPLLWCQIKVYTENADIQSKGVVMQIKFGDIVTYTGSKGFYSNVVFRASDFREVPGDGPVEPVTEIKIVPMNPEDFDAIEFLWVPVTELRTYKPKAKQLDGWRKQV